jgi:tryptophan-rich sensory protein
VNSSAAIALAICAAGAALEGLTAGTGVRQRFAELRLPRYSPPLALWVAVGILYYAVCFIVAYRLLRGSLDPVRSFPLALLLALMLANALWNYLFFRCKTLAASATAFLPYGLLALVLFISLLGVDRVASWAFLLYLIYLPYAAWWLFALRRANTMSE